MEPNFYLDLKSEIQNNVNRLLATAFLIKHNKIGLDVLFIRQTTFLYEYTTVDSHSCLQNEAINILKPLRVSEK